MPLETRGSTDCCRVQETTARRPHSNRRDEPELNLWALRSATEVLQLVRAAEWTPLRRRCVVAAAEEAGHRDDAAAMAGCSDGLARALVENERRRCSPSGNNSQLPLFSGMQARESAPGFLLRTASE